MQYYSTKSKGKKFIQNLDILIEKANIRKYIFMFSAEVLLLICTLLSILTFCIAYTQLFNIFTSLVLSVFAFFIPIYTLKIKAYRNAEKVDRHLVYYINVLKNFCCIQDDIVFAADKSILYLKEPLMTYNYTFVNEVKHGISIYDALDNYKRKVANKKFRIFIKNLQLCARYKGSYLKTLSTTRDTMQRYAVERSRRKKEVRKQRFSIAAMLAFTFIIISGCIKINPELEIQFKKDFLGQAIAAYNICVILYSIYKCLTLEQLEY